MKNPSDVAEEDWVENVGEMVASTIEAYQRSPVLRMLVKLVPPLAVAEAGILGTYAYFQNRRLQVFADEFITLDLLVSKVDAERQEFFDAYTSTARRVLAESRDEKIRLFARLFGEFINCGCATPIDRYEEHLLVLGELSVREFYLLRLLGRHEAMHLRDANENHLQWTNRFWTDFTAEAKAQLGLEEDNLQAALSRLTRTGMYQEIIGGYLDYTGGRGYLTVAFSEFLVALGISSDFQPNSAD